MSLRRTRLGIKVLVIVYSQKQFKRSLIENSASLSSSVYSICHISNYKSEQVLSSISNDHNQCQKSLLILVIQISKHPNACSCMQDFLCSYLEFHRDYIMPEKCYMISPCTCVLVPSEDISFWLWRKSFCSRPTVRGFIA